MSGREGDQDSMLDLPGARSLTSVHKASTQDLTATGDDLKTPPPDETSTPRAPTSDGQCSVSSLPPSPTPPHPTPTSWVFLMHSHVC